MNKEIDLNGQIKNTLKKVIEIYNSKGYLDTAKKLSDYIKALSLTPEQNDKLIDLITKHNSVARKDAFKQGIEFTLNLTKDKSNKYN